MMSAKENNEVKYILIYSYHDINYDIYDNLSMVRLAIANLKENYKNDSDFSYQVYCGKDVKKYIEKLEVE